MNVELWAVGLVVLAGLLGSLGPIYLKKASDKFSFKTIFSNYYLFLGVIFYGIGTVLFIPALKGGDLSILYPLIALTYIWVSFLSIKMLGEKMNRFKWIGILLIIIGVTFIGLGS